MTTHPLEHRYRGEHPIATLLYLFEGDYQRLGWAAFFYLIKHSPTWVMPILTAFVIDTLATRSSDAPTRLMWAATGIILLVVQNIPMHMLYVRFVSAAVRNTETRLRSSLARRLQQLSIGYFKHHSAGTLQNKLVRDVEQIEQTTRQVFDGGLSGLTGLTAAIVTTAIRAPGFLVFYAVCVPVAIVLVQSLRGSLQRGNATFRTELEALAARLNTMTQLIPVTRAHGVEETELARVDEQLAHVREAGLRVDTVNALFGAASWVVFQLFSVLCLFAAAVFYLTGWMNISIGDIVLLTAYFNTITGSILVFAGMVPQISKGLESVRSIGEVLESPDLEHNEGKAKVSEVRGEVEFARVGFSYPENEGSAIRDFSLKITPGETIAFVGPSGAGKSTLLNLAIGFLRPHSGKILLDGRDMNELDLRTYRRFVSVVPQETILFDGSIRENVLYGERNIPDERLWQALRAANAAEFVEQLPERLDTLVGERGARLSGGQKQRLAIARALIRNPRVLILDEATSAVDTVSERLIQEALERLMKDRTTLVVAHRLSTIRNADRIVVLEDGKLAEIGTHEQLVALGGIYAKM